MRALIACLPALALALVSAGPLRADDRMPDSAADALDRLLSIPSHDPDAIDTDAPPPDAVPAPAGPDEAAAQDGDDPATAEAPTLDALFAELRRETSVDDAERIAGKIQAEWLASDSATVDLLMGWASQAVAGRDHGAAYDLYEQVMLLEPGYAEAWNARATLNFQLDEYGRSLADIEQTLAREPRHFGALVGLGAILEEMGRDDAALEAYRRAVAVYPALRPAQDAVARLAAKVRGQSL